MKHAEKYDAYLAAIRRRVCSTCLDGQGNGTCGLTGRICAIENHLPRVVEAILGVDSPRLDEYVDAIRAQVCSNCDQQNSAGRCELRDHADCALDAYLALVIDAIEDVRGPLIRA